MPSTTLKRTAATLGVLAGLLATAGPASAMPIYMKVTDDGVVAAAGTQVGSEGVSDGRKPQGQYDQASPF